MAKLGFYFDATKCIGCRACQVQCKDKNRLGVGPVIRKNASYCVGTYPEAKCFHVSKSCNHCEKAACYEACPVGAIYKDKDGIILHDKKLCVGCLRCVESCPYEHMQYNKEKGVAAKCDSCYAIRKAGGNPACVDACTMRALDFGDLEALEKKYGKDLINHIPVLAESADTEPSLRIKAKECALSKEAKEMWL
ncbi:MAG: 4Fe-4S dicluster domain-containing protein [Cellulosilyticaceae bacterium]